jgi:hypothetical protein
MDEERGKDETLTEFWDRIEKKKKRQQFMMRLAL